MSEEKQYDEASHAVINFLKANIPKSGIPDIENDLKRDFLLAKKRSKEQKKKPKKKKSQVLTRNEKKALGFYNIPRNSLKYSEMLSLNEVWTDYMTQIIEIDKINSDCTSKSWEQLTQSIYKADFHGSILHILRSKCPSYVGKTGICVMDTKNTFKLLSKDNTVSTIPKKECVFEMYLKDNKIVLYGKHLCTRPAERSVKKIKSYIHPDL